MDKIAKLKAQLSQKDVKVRKETESNDRKISAVESKLKVFVNDTASGIIGVAKQIIEGNNKLRTRVNSLKGAIVTPTKSPSSEQAISSVANILDMSMAEVNDLLGLRTRDPVSNQQLSGGRTSSPIRAMHEQAIRRIKEAFTTDNINSIAIQENLMQLINEKIRLEKQLSDVQKSLQNKKKATLAAAAAVKSRELTSVARKIDLDSSSTWTKWRDINDGDHSGEDVVTNVHISRRGSIEITQELPFVNEDAKDYDKSFTFKESDAEIPVHSTLRPQKRAALKRRLKELQREAGIETNFDSPEKDGKRSTKKTMRISRGESFNASLLSPSPFKK